MTKKIEKALTFGILCHDEVQQVRKYTGEPYWVHPIEVASIVATVPHTEDMICAALLHDTVEDTKATLENIESLLGKNVANLVEMLTDVAIYRPPIVGQVTAGQPEVQHQNPKGAREERRKLNLAHTAKASPEAQTIKLADLISNSKNIALYDPDFAVTYMREKEKVLEVLTQGDMKLWYKADKILKDYFNDQENNEFYRNVAANQREIRRLVDKWKNK